MNHPNKTRRSLWVVLLFFLLLLIIWFLWPNGRYPLHPLRYTATPENSVNSEPLLVTFAELNADPMRYHNQRIRVTGLYQPLTLLDCFPTNGPTIHWALIAQNLQMNAQGYEQLLSRIAPATNLTVDGLWLLYAGPMGCGKQPPDGVVWYLVVERIVQPNPLLVMGYTPGAVGVVSGDITLIGQLPTPAPGTPGLPSPTTAVLSPTPTFLPGIATFTTAPTQFFTPPSGSTLATATNTLPPGVTVTATRTPTPNLSVTATRTPAPTTTATTTLPPPPSTTPPGYPAPPASPTTTASTPAYP